ncbi:dTDP-4-dehydrorhamnose reductase [Pseudoxanthomonas broegbernensis]|uniref:dTDP-4-dehydrorhamnose reductase n=1 Tax=Pseudoxanthomonas broegbernensis TaxID=83619 RepID=A0A7V8K6V4_9GAMM|nr:dTDP-4-dehydrorhamnose reductase [Pseudoxanthomonas broegbernensis]KAF1686126.1 dTDP-4-dehydrorhamnose reductase [Pseudoxanthomonas broegbernensis]MBB6063825.1 dTDP-4-dehydrorhamnose reductase [Pseudoxanthomonas broegbernensis]
MKLLLVGANGQLGRELRRSLRTLGQVVAATRDGRLDDAGAGDAAPGPGACAVADLSDPAGLEALVGAVAPDAVLNAAAYTAVDQAEGDAQNAFRVNAQAPGILARGCAAAGVPLVHYSTDYVFDGQGTRPYREDDPTAPLGVYGASKLAGEDAVRAAGGRHLVLRTAWVYATHGHNFLRTMLRLGAEREELRVVADQVGTPTPAALIADVTAALLGQALADTSLRGTWHLTAGGDTSWHGFAEAIFAEAVSTGLLPRAPRVRPIATADYPTPARRPAYSCLDTARLRTDFGIEPPHWHDGLRGVIAALAAAR